MFSAKLLYQQPDVGQDSDETNYFKFTDIIRMDRKILKCRDRFRSRLRIPSSAAPRNEQNETIGFGFLFIG